MMFGPTTTSLIALIVPRSEAHSSAYNLEEYSRVGITCLQQHLEVLTRYSVPDDIRTLAREMMRAHPPTPEDILRCSIECGDVNMVIHEGRGVARFAVDICSLCLFIWYGDFLAMQPAVLRDGVVMEVIAMCNFFRGGCVLITPERAACVFGANYCDDMRRLYDEARAWTIRDQYSHKQAWLEPATRMCLVARATNKNGDTAGMFERVAAALLGDL